MSLTQKIFSNTIGQVTFRSLDIILGIITLGMITRYLGQQGFGYYTTITAYLQLFVIVIDFGLYLTLLRELSAKPEHEAESITNTIFTMRLISSACLLILSTAISFLLPLPTMIQWGILTLSASFLFSTLISTITAPFQKYLRMTTVAAVNFISRALLLIGTVYVIRIQGDLPLLLFISTLAYGIGFVILAQMMKRLPTPLHLGLRFDIPYMTSVIQKTWPLAVTTALNLIYFKADTLILAYFQNEQSVGLYGASYRVLEIIATFPHMFMGLVLPFLTTAWIAHDFSRLETVWKKAFTFFAFITMPMIFGTFVVGESIMSLIAGNEFVLSGTILKILMIATAAIYFGTLFTYMVIVVDKQRAMIKYFGLTALVSVIGYFLAIPTFSYWGAAWVTVFSECLIIITAWIVIRKDVRVHIPWSILGKTMLASMIMAGVAWMILPYAGLLITICISAALYLGLSLLVRTIRPNDIRHIFLPS